MRTRIQTLEPRVQADLGAHLPIHKHTSKQIKEIPFKNENGESILGEYNMEGVVHIPTVCVFENSFWGLLYAIFDNQSSYMQFSNMKQMTQGHEAVFFVLCIESDDDRIILRCLFNAVGSMQFLQEMVTHGTYWLSCCVNYRNISKLKIIFLCGLVYSYWCYQR